MLSCTWKSFGTTAKHGLFEYRQALMPIWDPVAEGPVVEHNGRSPGGAMNSTTKIHSDWKCPLERRKDNGSKDFVADGVFESI